ncbi:O-antigen translocase [Aquicoccus sp. SU-CL01552]|uniref:O-antigen translocase n=1 Tax=Aquicoccus sp. SU-CL01552 TaxID=3127656 RepID=UPI0033404E7E
MADTSSSRGLIKSMLVIGSAQVVNILISIARMKVLAVLLGPSGVGLLSIYNNLLGMVTQTAGLGMGSSGVREIAASRGEEATLSRVRRVLFAAHLVQGALAMVAVWVLRGRIATWLFGDALRATEVGLIGVAILLTLLGTAQTALLQGLRRIGDLGRVTVFAAFAGTVAGLAAVWLRGESGLIWFILVQPLATVLIARSYTGRLPKPTAARLSLGEIWEIWKPMARLGIAFMLGGLATTATLLLVRGRILQELGLDAAGHFAAAWGMTMTYVGFLLGAMGADYYPRLTEVIHDRVAAVRLMNDQAQLGLAIGGPVLLLLIGLAPWVISLLYSPEFGPAVTLLQWQTLGNVFKLASWAMSFSIVAAARAKTFFFMELSFNIVFLTMVLALLPRVGLEVTAYAFVLGYLVYLTTVYVLARRIHGFRWEALSLGLLGLHAGLAVALLALALTAPLAAAIASPLLAGATGVFGLRVVLIKVGPQGRLATRLSRIYAVLGWPIRSET